MKISCKMEGAQTVINNLKKYDDDTKAKIGKAVNKSLNAIRRNAKNKIHSRTGNLKKGIRKNFDARVTSGTVRSRAPHAHLVEFGTKAKGVVKPRSAKAFRLPNGYMAKSFVHRGMKARPYLKPAYHEQKHKYVADLQKAVEHKG